MTARSDVTVAVRTIRPFSGSVVALCDGPSTDPESLYPLCATLSTGRRNVSVWLYDASQFPQVEARGTRLGAREVAVAHTLGEARLDIPRGASVDGLLRLPPRTRVRINASRVNDLPVGNRVQISSATARALDLESQKSRVLITSIGGYVASVLVEVRDHVPRGAIRASMLLRTLLQAGVDDEVMLSERHPVSSVTPSRGSMHALVRVADRLFEHLLTRVFRAPAITLQSVQPPPSDDDSEDVVRLGDSALTALGAAAGDQVLVEWDGRMSAARALKVLTRPADEPAIRPFQGVDNRPDSGEAFPGHLVVHISATVRRDLGLPVGGVVTVRRRVRTAAQARLNQLTVPLLGLLLAAAALKDVSAWVIVGGALLTALFGLTNLRIPRPPKGLF